MIIYIQSKHQSLRELNDVINFVTHIEHNLDLEINLSTYQKTKRNPNHEHQLSYQLTKII